MVSKTQRKHIEQLGLNMLGAVQQSNYWNGKIGALSIVLNPAAGGLKRRSSVKKWLRDFSRAGVVAGIADDRSRLFYTDYVGQGIEIGRSLGRKACADDASHLIVSCGGDGSHQELLTGLLQSDSATGRIQILRIPMGSGNDAADVASIQDAICILRGGAQHSSVAAVETTLAGGERIYAFNIASFGLDACVVALSNRFKRFRLMPGDSYKLAANILSLFYRPDFSHGPIVLEYTQAGEDNMPKTETLTGEIVLLAVGVSGKRVYGQGKHVLPGNENVCAISDMSMWQRLGLRNMFFRGEHIHHPNTCMCNAHTLRLQFHAPLYFQADGEQRLLQAQDFPLQMRIISVPVDYLTVDPACGQTQ